ncbi:MAG: hypothetical protein IPL61_14880 [Myxococcales bacterium]|nr:hypothetical protein [Myxococcales bacterium]
MIHVLLASTVPLLLFFGSWWRRGRHTSVRALVVLPLVCMASGVWAVVPDLPRLFGDLPRYVDMHHTSYCNVFWGHCAIDAHDDIDSSMVFPVLFVLVTAAVFLIGWRELARRE